MNQSQGESLFMQGKIDEAVVELQKEAKMGAPRAMYLIGCCLREGYGHVEADERKAVKWFQKGYEEVVLRGRQRTLRHFPRERDR